MIIWKIPIHHLDQNARIILKLKRSFFHKLMLDRMANNVHPDQTAPSLKFYNVCLDQSVQMITMVVNRLNWCEPVTVNVTVKKQKMVCSNLSILT